MKICSSLFKKKGKCAVKSTETLSMFLSSVVSLQACPDDFHFLFKATLLRQCRPSQVPGGSVLTVNGHTHFQQLLNPPPTSGQTKALPWLGAGQPTPNTPNPWQTGDPPGAWQPLSLHTLGSWIRSGHCQPRAGRTLPGPGPRHGGAHALAAGWALGQGRRQLTPGGGRGGPRGRAAPPWRLLLSHGTSLTKQTFQR